MKKVKEEFLLSIIFVGKWISLGLGTVGVLYVAIYFAYHKSYYDPRIEKFDYEISVLQEEKSNLIDTKNKLNSELQTNLKEENTLKNKKLPEAENLISKSKTSIESLGLKWWEKLSAKMIKQDKDVEAAYNDLQAAEDNKITIVESLENLDIEQEKSNKLISNISEDISDVDTEISEVVQDKKLFEVDVKGPVIWLASVLGLT